MTNISESFQTHHCIDDTPSCKEALTEFAGRFIISQKQSYPHCLYFSIEFQSGLLPAYKLARNIIRENALPLEANAYINHSPGKPETFCIIISYKP